jgi:hypothetical protein
MIDKAPAGAPFAHANGEIRQALRQFVTQSRSGIFCQADNALGRSTSSEEYSKRRYKVGVPDAQTRGAPMCSLILTAVMDRRQAVEQAFRRWIVRLWAAVVGLSLVLPVCANSGVAGSARPGLGVSRAALQAVFARQEFAFAFVEPHERRGVLRMTGTVPGKLMVLDLVGPPGDLTEVVLIVGRPSTDALAPPAASKVLAENMRYLRAVLRHTMPDWKDGVKWLNTQLQRSDERLEVGLRKGHREIVLLGVNRLSMVLLSIRVGQPLAPRGP